jgi:hypothetical protein
MLVRSQRAAEEKQSKFQMKAWRVKELESVLEGWPDGGEACEYYVVPDLAQ